MIFLDLLKNADESDDYEDVLYDVESLFTSIPVKEMVDYIIQIKPFCKESIFAKLLRKLPQEWVFSIKNRLIKQVDGSPLGGPISIVFSDIDVYKKEENIVIPANPIFYNQIEKKRKQKYVDDTFDQRKKYDRDKLFLDLNSYHENIKLKNSKLFLSKKTFSIFYY